MPKPLVITGLVIAVVLTIVIIFNVIGGSSSNMIEASESVQFANNCSDFTGQNGEALVYNQTDGGCYMTNSSFQSTANDYDLPLEGLFSSSGVVWLIFMGSAFILIIGLVLLKLKLK